MHIVAVRGCMFGATYGRKLRARMLVAVVFLHKLPQRDSHRLTLYLCKTDYRLARVRLTRRCEDSKVLLASVDMVCSTE